MASVETVPPELILEIFDRIPDVVSLRAFTNSYNRARKVYTTKASVILPRIAAKTAPYAWETFRASWSSGGLRYRYSAADECFIWKIRQSCDLGCTVGHYEDSTYVLASCARIVEEVEMLASWVCDSQRSPIQGQYILPDIRDTVWILQLHVCRLENVTLPGLALLPITSSAYKRRREFLLAPFQAKLPKYKYEQDVVLHDVLRALEDASEMLKRHRISIPASCLLFKITDCCVMDSYRLRLELRFRIIMQNAEFFLQHGRERDEKTWHIYEDRPPASEWGVLSPEDELASNRILDEHLEGQPGALATIVFHLSPISSERDVLRAVSAYLEPFRRLLGLKPEKYTRVMDIICLGERDASRKIDNGMGDLLYELALTNRDELAATNRDNTRRDTASAYLAMIRMLDRLRLKSVAV